MIKVVIVHGWGGKADYCWFPQVKKDLEKKAIHVEVPNFPDTDNPKLSEWLPKLKQVIENTKADELILVGHSAGCVTILRYLEQLPSNKKLKGIILVAGFTDDLGIPELKNFFESPLDLEKIKDKAEKFIAINSDNDQYVALKYGEEFKQKLNAKLIIKHNFNHFSGPVDDPKSITELPEVVENIKLLVD
jgi:uncharacterized protein